MGVLVDYLEFSINDITSLANKLSTIQNLSAQDRALLLAIFAAAAARAEVTDSANAISTLPVAQIVGSSAEAGDAGVTPATPQSLQEQLLTSYIPGNYFEG